MKKISKILAAFVAAVVTLLCYISFNDLDRVKEQVFQNYADSQGFCDNYYYRELNDEEKHHYVLLHKENKDCYNDSSWKLEEDEAHDLIQVFFLDYPERKLYGYPGSEYTAYSVLDQEEALDQIDGKLSSLYEKIEGCQHDFEKYTAIEMYIRDHVKKSTEGSDIFYTVNFSGNSQGCCDLYKYICNKFNLPCKIVSEKSEKSKMFKADNELVHYHIEIPINEGDKEYEHWRIVELIPTSPNTDTLNYGIKYDAEENIVSKGIFKEKSNDKIYKIKNKEEKNNTSEDWIYSSLLFIC